MSAAPTLPVETPDQVRWLEREMHRDMTAAGRVPVGVTQDHRHGLPIVVCRDGTVWTLESRPVDPETGDGRLYSWEMLPSIPGSQGDLDGVCWRQPARQNGRTA